MSIKPKAESLAQTSHFIMQVKDQYQQALQKPFGDLDFHHSAAAIKQIEGFGKAFKAHTSSPVFLEANQASQTITATRKFLNVAVKQDSMILPQKTREVALEILSGKPNRFASAIVQKSLGEGAFGKVDKVNASGEKYAVKTLFDPSAQKDLNKEYLNLMTLKHPRVMDVAYITQGKLYLEFVDGGTLEDNLKHLTPEETRKVFYQIAEGLSYMHQVGSIHQDIKGDNILLTKDKDVKIADLGLTKQVGEVKEGKKWRWNSHHLPPEFYAGKVNPGNAQKIDVWSFGILIWEALKKASVVEGPFMSCNGTHPIWGEKGFHQRSLEAHLDTTKRKSIDPSGELQNLMMKCLEKDPQDRPTMYEIKQVLDLMQHSRKEKRDHYDYDDEAFAAKRIC